MAPSYFQIPRVVAETTERFRVYGGFDTIGLDERLALTSLLLSKMNRAQPGPLVAVENFVGCFLPLFPDLAIQFTSMTSMIVQVVPVTSQMVSATLSGDIDKAGAMAPLLSRPNPDMSAVAIDSYDGVHAGLASLLMSIGKDAGTTVDANLMKARPDALIRRFDLSGDALLLLPGKAYGPSHDTLKTLYSSFSTYSEVRMKITQYMLGLSQATGHLPRGAEIIMNNFRLLRGSQMSHVTAITKFMRMHPWSLRVPELRPYYEQFAQDLVKFDAVEESVRQYHRLLVPQSEFLFISAEYRPLIAVSGDFIKEVEATFNSYVYNSSDYSALIQKVRAHEPTKAKYVGVSLLASLLNVQDQELPPAKEESTTTVAPMI